MYRLKTATGTFTGGTDKTANYTLEMGYDNLHNIISKKQNISQTGVQFNGTLNAGYELNYNINPANAQQITSITDKDYRYEGTKLPSPLDKDTEVKSQAYVYDANGNLKSVSTGTMANDSVLKATNERKLLWDEENRLLAVSDNGYVSNYIYDAAGERTVKMHGGSEGVTVNGKQAAHACLRQAGLGAVDFTAYVSPYLVVGVGGNYTKHIYAGSQRIISELANGMMNAENEQKAGNTAINYTTKANLWQAALKAECDSLGTKYGKINSTFAGNGTSTGNLLYFYHPDHLGSSSLVTDASGNVTQHIEYVPYGEVFIEEKNSTWRTPYKFNAKELDEETGLYYYGARYYDPKTSVWISVDPLAELYPNIGGYVYCAGNPILYYDPDGRGLKEWYYRNEFRIQKSAELTLNTLGAAGSASLAALPGGQGLAVVGTLYFADKMATNISEIANNAPQETLLKQSVKTVAKAVGANEQQAQTAANVTDDAVGLLLLAKTLNVQTKSLPAGNTLFTSRYNLANSFYNKSGFTSQQAINHIRGIDFSKPVSEIVLKKGTMVRQWVGETGVGNYFTTVENGVAKNLGIGNYAERELKTFILKNDVKVLKSTAAPFKGNAGGGTQYFSTQMKNSITEVK